MLLSVAVLSLYSVHLLLKISKEGGMRIRLGLIVPDACMYFTLECNSSSASDSVAHVSFLFCFGLFFPESLIYEKLGEKAFGWLGKCGVFISVTMQNIGGKSLKFSNF